MKVDPQEERRSFGSAGQAARLKLFTVIQAGHITELSKKLDYLPPVGRIFIRISEHLDQHYRSPTSNSFNATTNAMELVIFHVTLDKRNRPLQITCERVYGSRRYLKLSEEPFPGWVKNDFCVGPTFSTASVSRNLHCDHPVHVADGAMKKLHVGQAQLMDIPGENEIARLC
jgi:hypothetical protein